MKTKKFIRSNLHLPVKNLQQTIDYYRDTLGFYDEWTWNNEGVVTDGGIRRADMRLLFGEDPDLADINNYKRAADTLRTHPYGSGNSASLILMDIISVWQKVRGKIACREYKLQNCQ